MSPMKQTTLQSHFATHKDRFIEEWQDFLRFPSVSTNAERKAECARCATWLADHLAALGFTTRLIPTESHPLVFAERAGKPDSPTVLFYGHYDVQPEDPVSLWKTPPFEPTLINDRMFARGAQDNKGQLFAAIKAIETLIRADALHVTLKLLIEGDEETGEMPIIKVLHREQAALAADIVMAADTSAVSSGAPTITMGLRGIVHLTAVLSGPDHDLHSGVHGGRIPNPANALCRMIASLHKDDGRVAVEGFYDNVQDPTPEERALANAQPIDPAWYKTVTGLLPVGGELQYTPVERSGFRPAIDLNGIHSGYGGAGSKTIIAAQAMAKISARLVPGQCPERILKLITRHLQQQVPNGLTLAITEQGAGGAALRVALNSPAVVTARRVLGEISPLPTAFLWEGASVPILSHLPAIAGGDVLLVGFGSEEDNIHAPNESYSVEQFRMGFLYTGLFLNQLGNS
jgi:acetylornithine deacetylase/succinyl-diaminopimelate desuccinylase-like protein